ncbi:hypothetical protein ACS3SW_09780 [Roseobacteraceae bacterium S113]
MFESYSARSGTLEPVWRIEVQIRPDDADRMLDAITAVYPLPYGKYRRNGTVSGIGAETTQPEAGSTTDTHVDGFTPGDAMTYPMVMLWVSLPREIAVLETVMDAILDAHHYEQPVVYVREEWASRSDYTPTRDNPNRFWQDGRGLPERVSLDQPVAYGEGK